MPRTYSFDHFKVVPQASHRARPHGKSNGDSPIETGIHYGKQFAQTEELYQAHEMEHELEELARDDLKPAEPKKMSRPRPERRGKAEAKPMPEVEPPLKRGTPIGALPATEEQPPALMFREALDEAGRHARAMLCSAQDLYGAAKRLLALPFELAKLAAERMRRRPVEA